MREPLITFLSDYGHSDEFVGVCHGVIARRCPAARVIDITHAIPAYDVRAGAIVLADALPYMPAGVHLAVVDPQVGATSERARRAVALRTGAEDRLLVGPDNGLLALAAERFGGVAQAVEISGSCERLQPVSHTFHGRDLFAPVAAALADGERLAFVGEPLAPRSLVGLELPAARVQGGVLIAHVLRVDRFGNLILDASVAQLEQAGAGLGRSVALEVAGRPFAASFCSTFADVPAGQLVLYEDAAHRCALAVNLGSAAEWLGIGPDAELRVASA
jgi:S-adenosyl-L-methionine hydrolase (adenosine-forming)